MVRTYLPRASGEIKLFATEHLLMPHHELRSWMKIQMTIQTGVVGLLLLTGWWAALCAFGARAEQDRARSAEKLVTSLKLAHQLRQSSDDLTRMARIYVSTGDERLRDHFNHILGIRNGTRPRPPNYGGFFWDQVLSGKKTLPDEGEAVALRELMERMGFTGEELELLKEAEDNSNDLAELEQIAMNAMLGRFQNDEGKFSHSGVPDFEMARSIMFGSDYNVAKEQIMRPIDNFSRMIEQRLRLEMEKLHLRSQKLANWQVAVGFATGVTMLVAFFFLRGVVLVPLAALTRDAEALRNRDYSTRVRIRRKDEMGELGRTLNGMAESISEDIASRERAADELRLARDAARQADLAKSEFLANMSHEIRTPMNGIMGMTELLFGTELDKDQREYTDLISQSSESLLTVINDILDFSKIEAGKMSLDSYEFDLRDAIGDTLHTLSFRAAQKEIELAYKVHPDVPDCLVGDLGRVRQVLVNLVSNAIKFTEIGEVVVYVHLESEARDEVCLHVEVTDTGIGISPGKQKTIFESFTQAEGSTTRIYGGTGLGLTISRSLVELMDGRIWVESKPGEGSTFHFTLRLGLGKQERGLPQSPVESLHALPVLVVDDNVTNRKILREMLENWEMEPRTAAGGVEALELMAAARDSGKPFKLVLLDHIMPEMDGVEVARCIAEKYGEDAPGILMLSSSGRRVSAEDKVSLGIERELTKPVKPIELRDAITRFFGTSPRDEKGTRSEVASRPGEIPAMRVLLAEDGRVNQLVAVKLLEERGHSVVPAGDGQVALDIYERETFDAILMDVQMPRLDGYAATKVIREREAATGEHIPIIAMTAHAMTGDREKCLEAGMDDYLAKPVRATELFAVLEQFAVIDGGASPHIGTGGSGPSPSAPDWDLNIFNPERFRKELTDIELMRELIDIFPDEAGGYFEKARQASRQGDVQALHIAAHSLKGTFGNFFANRAYEAASVLTNSARSGVLNGTDEMLDVCGREMKLLHSALKLYRETLDNL